MIGSTARPGSVSDVRRRPCRTKIGKPSSLSNSRMAFDTPGCDVCSASAASVRLKLRRTVSRTKRS